jgi:hypothetical protein
VAIPGGSPVQNKRKKHIMKQLVIKTALSIILLFSIISHTFAQEEGEHLKALIEKQDYVFNATSATSQGGRTIQLTSEYDLKVSKDTVKSYLPFFGRAFSAPYNPTDGGIKFESKKFTYSKTFKKKKGWSILIKPGDVDTVNSLRLSVSESGYGTLSIISNQRSPISFYGYVTAPEKEKK